VRVALGSTVRRIRAAAKLRGDRFARQYLNVNAVDNKRPDEFRAELAPARWLEGRVFAQDTDRPLANSRLELRMYNEGQPSGNTEGWTDTAGRFRLAAHVGEFGYLTVAPGEGQPYRYR
jgi:hypothetical protein